MYFFNNMPVFKLKTNVALCILSSVSLSSLHIKVGIFKAFLRNFMTLLHHFLQTSVLCPTSEQSGVL